MSSYTSSTWHSRTHARATLHLGIKKKKLFIILVESLHLGRDWGIFHQAIHQSPIPWWNSSLVIFVQWLNNNIKWLWWHVALSSALVLSYNGNVMIMLVLHSTKDPRIPPQWTNHCLVEKLVENAMVCTKVVFLTLKIPCVFFTKLSKF